MLRSSVMKSRQRGGMILIVVLALLTLFAIVGISFVLVSDSMALSASIAQQAEGDFKPDSNPEGTFALFMGQLVYDVEDTGPQANVYSGLRGHSFARTMYGYDSANPSGNDKAFSGLGRTRIPSPFFGSVGASNPAAYLGYLVNHTYFSGDGFLHDPERTAVRANSGAPLAAYLPGNAPYTAPDHNSFFLAVEDPTTGRILVPSFHRPWLFGALDNQGNSNWNNQHGKYLTLRPRPAEHPGFPFPEDAGGDVKNRIGAPGGNDSIWIDIGAPVMTSADGRKYKALFAPLILDMDGRLNLSVHGNTRATGDTHASGQGWGPWEVNLNRLLNVNAAEVRQIMKGIARAPGRYGPDGEPGGAASVATPGTPPRIHAQVDFDGIDNSTGAVSTRFLLPGEPGTVPYQPFPSFPAAYGNGSNAERLNHMLKHNPFRPVHDDRHLPPATLAALLRRGGTGHQGLTTDLLRLMPNTLARTDIRNQITTHSMDIDRPGALPYIWTSTDAGTAYTWPANNGFPTGLPAGLGPIAQPFNDIPTNWANPQPGSEFDANFRSTLASKLRVNLNRRVVPYPAPDVNTLVITDLAGYNAAWQERILLATDLFNTLVAVTGVPVPNLNPNAGQPNQPAFLAPDDGYFRARRWLAQLAVNIVDYIDEDDYNTMWTWYSNGNINDTVFGTEQPNLLLNEVYSQLDNISNDPGIPPVGVAVRQAMSGYGVNVWVELFNPRSTDNVGVTPRDNIARTVINNQAVYQIVLAAYDDLTKGPAVLADPANVTGADRTAGLQNAATSNITPIRSVTADWTTAPANTPRDVLPANNAYNGPATGNTGFYVIGADNDFLPPNAAANILPTDPQLPTTFATPNMRLRVQNGENHNNFFPTVYLRRLACPHLPPGGNNPYITVDAHHCGNLAQRNDGRSFDVNGQNAGYVPVAQRRARGRMQPFAANLQIDQAPNPAAAGAQNTFYRQNALEAAPPVDFSNPNQTLRQFDWLVHLDRHVISPLELFHVSAWAPHQLADKFHQNGAAHQQGAKWLDPNTRLARFFEYVQTAPRTVGVTQGGRMPGKINLNTMSFHDPVKSDVFRALCDAQSGNAFTDAQVDAVYQALRAYRFPSGATPGTQPPDAALAGANAERPLWSLAAGVAPGADQWTGGPRGLEQTLLAPRNYGGTPTDPRLFDPHNGGAHPYLNLELLNKIYNNVTVRSNVFAVWVTVGYFEVRNENARPVTLGAEIGRSEGRHVRHRFFSLVDRTKMEMLRGNLTNSGVTQQAGTTSYLVINPIPTLSNQYTGKTWQAQPGNFLTINPDSDTAETLALEADPNNGAQLRAVARLSYPAGVQPVLQYGNPGPWLRYDPKKDPCILYTGPID